MKQRDKEMESKMKREKAIEREKNRKREKWKERKIKREGERVRGKTSEHILSMVIQSG